MGREAASLVLIFGVTAEAAWYGSLRWAPVDTTIRFGSACLVAGLTVLVVLPRRRLPILSLLGAAVLFGWYPSSAVALALASYERPGG